MLPVWHGGLCADWLLQAAEAEHHLEVAPECCPSPHRPEESTASRPEGEQIAWGRGGVAGHVLWLWSDLGCWNGLGDPDIWNPAAFPVPARCPVVVGPLSEGACKQRGRQRARDGFPQGRGPGPLSA